MSGASTELRIPSMRTSAGQPVKSWLIRSIHQQHQAVVCCHEALDRLLSYGRSLSERPPNNEKRK